jgi:2-hydroxychromene-2-carboxylate isomerase
MSDQIDTMRRDSREVSRDWILVIVHGPSVGSTPRHLRLQEAVIPIGRTVDHPSGIRIADPLVSRDGIRLERNEDHTYTLSEEGALNPVRVNGTKLREPRVLQSNDVIRIGDTLLVADRAELMRHAAARSRQAALLESLGLLESTARGFFESETRFFDPNARCAAVNVDGFAEARTMAQWLADEWEIEFETIDAQSADLVDILDAAGPEKLVFVERLDAIDGDALVRATGAIERRASSPDERRVAFSYGYGAPPPLVRRLLDLASDGVFRIPPLAARRADILPALRVEVQRLGLAGDFAYPAAGAERLLCHDWPGGLGELRRVARRVARQLQEGGEATELSLSADILAVDIEPDAHRGAELTPESFETAYVEYDGCIADIAAHFGFARTYFYRKLKKDGIDIDAIRARTGIRNNRSRSVSTEGFGED